MQSTSAVSMISLVQEHIREADVYHEEEATPVTSTPLIQTLILIYYMPYRIRKFLLDFSRIQQPVMINSTLFQAYTDIRKSHAFSFYVSNTIYRRLIASGATVLGNYPNMVTIDDIVNLTNNYYDNPMACSILSYYARAEQTSFLHEFLDAGKATIDKELAATQQPNRPQQLDYSCLFTELDNPIHYELSLVPKKTIKLWKDHLHRLSLWFTSSSCILFPHFSDKKNMSYPTQALIEECLNGEAPVLQPTHYTSLDLLKLYAKTGIQIGGDVELRVAWRFNDLKPRGYYCLGGTPFWAALFIRDFTKKIQEAFPSTHPFSRFDVTRIRIISEDEIVITYDYEAFTTSLAELKYFLWYLANAFDGVYVAVLDVFRGVEHINLGEYLREYNESVNIHQIVSLCRLLNRHQSSEETTSFYQCRSGSLGIGGNIGLSTLLHGISAGGMTDNPFEDSIVGDDALMAILKDAFLLYFIIINKLGIINIDKVSTLPRPDSLRPQDEQIHGFKYLKRPIALDASGQIKTGILDNFPNVAPCLFPGGDNYHTETVTDLDSTLKAFCTQWGKYLGVYRQTSWSESFDEDDTSIILASIRCVYRTYGIPLTGALPNSHFYYKSSLDDKSLTREIDWWVPPCDTPDVFSTPWMDQLFATYGDRSLLYPSLAGEEISLPRTVYEGCTGYATSSRLLTILEKLGHVETYGERVLRTFDEHLLRDVKQFLEGGKIMKEQPIYSFKFNTIPFWYDDVYIILYPSQTTQPTFAEAYKDVSTMMSLSDVEPEYDLDTESSDYGFAE